MNRKRRGLSPARAGGSSFQERRTERLPLDESSSLRHRFAVEVKVRDLSACGFMAECDEWVEIGSTVSLDVPGIGPVQAQVRWQIGNRMGGMFLDPISLRQCEWTAVRAEASPLETC
ncbi:MAG TPA: PilZ domain-containing protein [Allosphingosinicella sp.]|jgi:hypothetical protein